MIATLDEFKVFIDMAETDDSQNELLYLYLNAVDALFNELCDREFDSASYTHELYNGTGGQRLWLRNIPVTAIAQISLERIPAIKIRNTSSDASRASVVVDVSAQTITLTVVGGTNADSDELDLTAAAQDTFAELATVIAALGSGWEAEIYDTDLNSIPSTELIEILGLNCGVPRGGGDATWKNLDIPGTPIANFRVEKPIGEIYCPSGFQNGYQNIIVSYTAGYSSTTMPHELKMGVLAGAQALYVRGAEVGFGANSFSQAGLNIKYGDWLPDITLQMIKKYTRVIL